MDKLRGHTFRLAGNPDQRVASRLWRLAVRFKRGPKPSLFLQLSHRAVWLSSTPSCYQDGRIGDAAIGLLGASGLMWLSLGRDETGSRLKSAPSIWRRRTAMERYAVKGRIHENQSSGDEVGERESCTRGSDVKNGIELSCSRSGAPLRSSPPRRRTSLRRPRARARA